MFDKIRADYRAVFEMDPAATSRLEVVFTYAGFHAILMHRAANWLHRMGMPFFARVLSQTARFLTGIEIHPAARIGKSFFIDHGMGVVIGETTEIGEHVTLFQGVTLGGTGKERGKRHPTIGNFVVVGTGAKVLGGITIGDHVKVGANAVVLRSVPPHSTVVGVPGRIVKMHGEKLMEEALLDHTHMPDPLNEMLVEMQKQISRLEQRLDAAGPEKKPAQAGGGERPRKAKKAVSAGRLPLKEAKVDELPMESVQERQARMARMEKEERMRRIAFKKQREQQLAQQQAQAASQPEGGPPSGGAPPSAQPSKKRTRRRRRARRPAGETGAPAVQGGAEPARENFEAEGRPAPVAGGEGGNWPEAESE